MNLFRSVLKRIFHEVRVVDVLDSGDTAHLAMMKRPDLGVTFTKLHCWTLTQYSKCVFLDADTLVRLEVRIQEKDKTFRCLTHVAVLFLFLFFYLFVLGDFKYRRAV